MRLEFDGLACRRGGRVVFRNVSFAVEPGAAALVRGPNGVGKSTLLRVLAGLIPPLAGEVRMDGQPADASMMQERSAYAGHLDSVKPALSVHQNLAVWAGIFGTAPARIDEGLVFFGLDAIADRPVAQCSAGQKRRLGLARLMVMDRPVWLMDEPTVSLDTESAGLVAQLVQRHCADGGVALIATHIDLALPPGPVLTMTPPGPEVPRAETDAFLAGDWR